MDKQAKDDSTDEILRIAKRKQQEESRALILGGARRLHRRHHGELPIEWMGDYRMLLPDLNDGTHDEADRARDCYPLNH
jgi:hypothetical protein